MFFPSWSVHLHAQGRLTLRPSLGDTVVAKYAIVPRREIRRPKIGLVLSGGGGRALSQIGVLKALERSGIPVDFIAGTSMGAIVGGLYAAGWTVSEIESIATHTDWDEELSLAEDTRRTDLFLDQKVVVDRSFLVVRFQGLRPVIPPAVSSGQRLTNMLSSITLQSLYHPNPSFDDLKIPFRAVATDLISGRRIVIGEGSLAEALRASVTVPLLFSPIERDGMELVDGGLVSNIPVDVARDAGCDIVIAVNSTSGLRLADEMQTPWETADQIMGIMMQKANRDQLEQADLVITPHIGRHLSSDFTRVDSLIAQGDQGAQQALPQLLDLYERQSARTRREGPGGTAGLLRNARVQQVGDGIPDSLWSLIVAEARSGVVSLREIQDYLDLIYAAGDVGEIYADVVTGEDSVRITYVARVNPILKSVRTADSGHTREEEVLRPFENLVGRPVNNGTLRTALEEVLRTYRGRGYSLARLESMVFDAEKGVLSVRINEGTIRSIRVEGGVRTQDWFVLREFPLEEGDIFEIEKAKQGIININGTTLFEYVYLEVSDLDKEPGLTIRLKERPSQLVRFGLRADNERNLQGLIDLRDENYRGTGMQLGLTVAGGSRNVDMDLVYKAQRLLSTQLTFGIGGFYRRLDSYVYEDAPPPGENRWRRQQVGEYSVSRLGGEISFGSQLERLGNVTVSYVLQKVRIRNLENLTRLVDHYRLGMLRVGTVVDTKESYPFPSAGVGLNISYELAPEAFGTEPGYTYNALRLTYEHYSSIGSRFTLHPRVTVGFADKTMPLSEQFRLGGRNSFFGLREDDRRGRQMLLVNFEIRYRLPIEILFDAYLQARYDFATISEVPEEIKFSTLRHGVGLELAIDTPIGPAYFSVGKSFYFGKNLPENPIQEGPFVFYVSVGYEL